MKVPFVGPAYAARSLNADAQRAVNCYLETDSTSERVPLALYGTPGTVLSTTCGSGPIRGIIADNGDAVLVSGNQVWRKSGATTTNLGTIGSLTGRVGMCTNGTQILIVDGVGGWLVQANVLTAITDVDFPAGVTKAAFLDGYFVVTGDGTQKFYINQDPYDGAAWNALDFASAEGSPDHTVGCIVNQLELWLFGSESAEVWSFTGNSTFPIERSGNTFVDVGTASADTLAKIDNSVFWLGSDSRGNGIVWRSQGYTPARVSNHALEHAIQGYTTVSDAFAFTYQQEGHGFYVLTFPTADATWVYDVASNTWHERQWRDPNTAAAHRWRPNCHAFVAGEHLVGDFENGKLYTLDLDTCTDNGDPILRLRTTQCMDSPGGERMFYQSLQVDMEAGVGAVDGDEPLLMLRYSNDGGHTWSNQQTRSAGVGNAGEYGKRVKFGPTGSGRNRVWEISMTAAVKFAVFGAYLNAERGSS